MVHGASKQPIREATPSTSTPNQQTQQQQGQMIEGRVLQANEQSPSNAETINQTNTAPPGTGPPPMLNESPEINPPQATTEVTQTNGKIFKTIINYCKCIVNINPT